MRITTKVGKLPKAAIKQIVTQKLQAKEKKMP